jgi:hypothetical protein
MFLWSFQIYFANVTMFPKAANLMQMNFLPIEPGLPFGLKNASFAAG